MGLSARLEQWAGRIGRHRPSGLSRGRLRFAFYGRVPTEDWQDLPAGYGGIASTVPASLFRTLEAHVCRC